MRGVREVVLERALVDGDGAGSFTDPDSGDSTLAAAGGLYEWVRHDCSSPLRTCSGGGQVQRLRLLSAVGMIGTRVHLELLQHLATEAVLREHAPDGATHGL